MMMAGTGANATAEALALTRFAKEAGADSCLSVVPYYNKPTQEGLYRHFAAIAEVGLPVILYNVPGRTVADLANDTILRLAGVPNIVGVKDATADIARGSELVRELRRAGRSDFVVLSGDPLSVYTRVEQTWVEGRKLFDLSRPEDHLIAVGGDGAMHGERLDADEEEQ